MKTTGAGIGEAHTHGETLLEAARDKYETAAAHGWGGVASTMEQAVEHLESVVGQLQSTEQSCETASTVLDGIDAKMSSPEVAEHRSPRWVHSTRPRPPARPPSASSMTRSRTAKPPAWNHYPDP